MGLFDKRKKSDDFDSPVENVDLSAPPGEPAAPARAQAQAQARPQPEPSTIVQETHMEADAPPEDDDYDVPAYGIDDAIQLMRALPPSNVELVVQVVKRTLESTKVKVKTIIDDATRKQNDIEGRIEVLGKEIAEYEQEIKVRKEEIEKLETDHKETSMVKDRLQLAEKLTTKPTASKTSPGTPAPAAPAPAAQAPAAGQPQRPRPGGTLPPAASSGTGSSSASGPGTATGQQQTTAKGTTIVAKK